jgi:porin
MLPSMNRDIIHAVIAVGFCAQAVCAQDTDPAPATPAQTEAAAEPPAAAERHTPAGLVPLIDYTGDIWTRPRLLGDLGGSRTDLANKGIQFDINFTQIMQSVVDGGLDTGTRYGGTIDYNIVFDLHRMGVLPGAIIKFRGESRYGESVNGIAGPILPVNADGSFPLTDELDEDIPFTITTLTYMQFLSEHIGFLIGKFDTIDGDPNEFASGRGTSQFMNGNLVFPTSPILMAPYSTLGAGIILVPAHGVTISSVVYNITDSSTTTGFGDIGDGAAWLTEAQFQYKLGELPGGQNIGFGYAFDSEFADLGGRLVFQPGQGLARATKDSTWAAYWSAWQYVWVNDDSEAPIDLMNGVQDRQGVGLFARFGFSDKDTNTIEWTASGGLGGKGIIPGRERDTCGVGVFYLSVQPDLLIERFGVGDHSQGLEAYYNLSITPATNLSFDLQIADSPLPDTDTAVILGLRLGLRF